MLSHRFIWHPMRRVFVCVGCGHQEAEAMVLAMTPIDDTLLAWSPNQHVCRAARIACPAMRECAL